MITITMDDIVLELRTDPALFSPRGLDTGTAAMLSCVTLGDGDKVLDLGCGYGVVGIYAARRIGADRVTMADISPLAVEVAAENAIRNGVEGVRTLQSDGLRSIADRDFTLILSNPPYHTDFHVPKHFIEQGFHHLAPGGRLVMVTKRRDWYKNKLIAIFGGVRIEEVGDYHVFLAEKRGVHFANRKKRR